MLLQMHKMSPKSTNPAKSFEYAATAKFPSCAGHGDQGRRKARLAALEMPVAAPI